MNKFTVFFRKYGHKLLTFFIGLAFIALCIFLVVLGVNRVYHMFRPANIYEAGVDPDLISDDAPFDDLRVSGLEEGSAEYFEQYIANFVRQNFPTFTSTLSLHTDYFISYGIWQAIAVNRQGVYAYRDDGTFLIPKADVERFARLNFDYAGSFTFHTVEVNDTFTYDRLSGCYTVGASTGERYLVPDVTDVQFDEETGVYTLTVDCYYSDALSEEDPTKNPNNFSKRISITLETVEEVQTVDGADLLVTNYRYTSCALVDETLSQS